MNNDLIPTAVEDVKLALGLAFGIIKEVRMEPSDANRCRVAKMLLDEVNNSKEILREKAKVEASKKVIEQPKPVFVDDHYEVAEKAIPSKPEVQNEA